jgi:hypothetical protein
LFADDTTLYLSHSNIEQLILILNSELRKITDFFRASKISLHPKKSKFMVFSNSPQIRSSNIEIKINFNNVNEDLDDLKTNIIQVMCNDNIPAIRFLGIYFDPLLNFKYHVSIVNSKLSKALFVLRSVKNYLTQKSLKSIYFALFHCHLIYCLPVFSSTSPSTLKKTETLQKSAVRIISQSKYNAHTEPIFKNLKIIPFNGLIEFFNLQFMQQFINDLLPASFREMWTTIEERRRESTLVLRNGNTLDIPFSRLSSSALQPLIKMPKSWIEFTREDIKIIRNKLEFKRLLKLYFLERLSPTVYCTRLICPVCSNITS